MVTRTVELFEPDGTRWGELRATVAATVEFGEPAPTGKMTVYSDDDVPDGWLVRCTYGQAETPWMVDGEDETSFVARRHPSDRAGSRTHGPRVFSLVGAAGMLANATVDADGGMDELAAERRPFGPARVGYDDSEWVSAVSAGTKDNPNFDRDSSWPEDWGLTGDAHYIHPTSDGSDVDAGRGPVRTEFTLDDDAEVTCQLTVDDELPVLWFAGRNPISAISGLYQWQRTFTFAVQLPAGDHAIYAVVNNLDRGSDNPAHLLLAAVDADGVPVAVSDTSWKAWPTYPATIMPGENAGIISGVLVGEAQDPSRASIPATLTLGYTDAADSGGVEWSHETSWDFEVRQDSVLDAHLELMRLCDIDHVDLSIGASGPRLDMWQTYGVDRSGGASPQQWEADGEIVGGSRGRIPPGPNDVWTLTGSGWTYADDAAAIAAIGRIEAGAKVGVAKVPETLGVAKDTALAGRTEPRRYRYEVVETAGKVWASSDPDDDGWWLGDTVRATRPDDVGPVKVMKVSFDTALDPVRWSVVAEPVGG